MTSTYEPRTKIMVGPFTPSLIIHGGAGNITRPNLPPEVYAQYKVSLTKYLESTYALLIDDNADAVTAACHAVSLMEDDPLFNCGKGSVFNVDGGIEMEASLMVSSVSGFRSDVSSETNSCPASVKQPGSTSKLVGRTKKSAAVSMITHTRHPILLAKEVLGMADLDNDELETEQTQSIHPCIKGKLPRKTEMHAHLSGQWVEEWGFKERGLERKSRKWFWTRKRWEEHRRGLGLDTSDQSWSQKLTEECSHSGTESDKQPKSDDAFCGATSESGCCSTATKSEIHQTALHDKLEVPSQGTVGAVCMDSWGNLCVATSTGGLTNKRSGRIGDTPTVGAGFWAESWEDNLEEAATPRETAVTSKRHFLDTSRCTMLSTAAIQATKFWVGDCLQIPPTITPARSSTEGPTSSPVSLQMQPHGPVTKMVYQSPHINSRGSIIISSYNTNSALRKKIIRRAVAMSGTGNGDSFLRTNAARTAAAIPKFTSCSSSTELVSLQQGVTAIAGPGGELQRSAEDRWGHGTGEGEGGIIGIEVVMSDPPQSSMGENEKRVLSGEEQIEPQVQTNVVWDFNCGGMWRAYYETSEKGRLEPRVMVFKEEYR